MSLFSSAIPQYSWALFKDMCYYFTNINAHSHTHTLRVHTKGEKRRPKMIIPAAVHRKIMLNSLIFSCVNEDRWTDSEG